MKTLLHIRSQSQLSPLDRPSNQLAKGLRLRLYSALLLAKENKLLRAANQKQKQKRIRSRRQIPVGEGLFVQEASALIIQSVEAVKTPGEGLRHVYSREGEH